MQSGFASNQSVQFGAYVGHPSRHDHPPDLAWGLTDFHHTQGAQGSMAASACLGHDPDGSSMLTHNLVRHGTAWSSG
jgi:hypothetical protein